VHPARIVFEEEPSRDDLDALKNAIDAFNYETTGFRDGRYLTAFVRDDDGRMIAGLSGFTWGGYAKVEFLWIADPHRRAGLGRRLLTAQLVIDESTAMAIGRDSVRASRLGFYATGIGVFVLWNIGTAVGVIGASWLSDPRLLGLDAAAPAAFLALLAPRLRGRETWIVALTAALVALVAVPFVPVGFPVLIAALVGVVAGLLPQRRPAAESSTDDDVSTGEAAS